MSDVESEDEKDGSVKPATQIPSSGPEAASEAVLPLLEDAEIISDEEEEAAGGEGTSIENGNGKEERKKLSVKAWAIKKEPGIQQDEEKPETEAAMSAGASTALEVSLSLFLRAGKSCFFLVSCLFTSNDPGRVSQDLSGSGCGPAAGWFSSLSRPRRSPPYSLCGFCMHFYNCSLISLFLCLLGPCSRLPRLCLNL